MDKTLADPINLIRKKVPRKHYVRRPVGRPPKSEDTIRISVRISREKRDKLVKRFGTVTKAIDKILELLA